MQPSLEAQFILQTDVTSLCLVLSSLEDGWLCYSNVKQKTIYPTSQTSLLTRAQWLTNNHYRAFKQNKLISALKILQDRWALFPVGPIMHKRKNCRCLKLAGPDRSTELICRVDRSTGQGK